MAYVKKVDMRVLVAKHGKRCPRCGRKKSADEFSNNASRYDGKQCYCKSCFKTDPVIKSAHRKYLTSEKGKAKRAQYDRAYRARVKEDPEKYEYQLWCKARAKRRKRREKELREAGITDEALITRTAIIDSFESRRSVEWNGKRSRSYGKTRSKRKKN